MPHMPTPENRYTAAHRCVGDRFVILLGGIERMAGLELHDVVDEVAFRKHQEVGRILDVIADPRQVERRQDCTSTGQHQQAGATGDRGAANSFQDTSRREDHHDHGGQRSHRQTRWDERAIFAQSSDEEGPRGSTSITSNPGIRTECAELPPLRVAGTESPSAAAPIETRLTELGRRQSRFTACRERLAHHAESGDALPRGY